MIFLLSVLVTLRVFFWWLLPQYGITEVADIVFAFLALTIFVMYRLSQTKSQFAPWITLWLFAVAQSFFHSTTMIKSGMLWFSFLVCVFGFASITKKLSRDRTNIRILWNVMLIGAAICAIRGIVEFLAMHWGNLGPGTNSTLVYILSNKRACSFQGWPTAFAGYLILFIPSVVFSFMRTRGWMRFLYGVLGVLLLLGLGSSVSVLAPVSLCLAFVLSGNAKRLRWVLMMLGFIILFAGEAKIITSFFESRWEYMSTVLLMIKQHPFIGSGIGSFASSGAAKSVFAHNSYLQVWAETGVVGFVSITGMFFTLWRLKPKKDPLAQGIYIGLLAFFIDNIFSFSILKPNLAFTGWAALAIFSALHRYGEVHPNESYSRD